MSTQTHAGVTQPFTGNSDGSSDSRARSLANLKPFKLGQSSNPKGRPKGIFNRSALRQLHQQVAEGTKQVESRSGYTYSPDQSKDSSVRPARVLPRSTPSACIFLLYPFRLKRSQRWPIWCRRPRVERLCEHGTPPTVQYSSQSEGN